MSSQRRFGVEIEFGTQDRYREYYCECGCGTWTHDTEEDAGINQILAALRTEGLMERGWGNWCYDGSELELQSPILQGPDGFAQLRAVYAILNGMGCYTGGEDGMHVHHDAPEFVNNETATKLLVRSWYQNQNNIYPFVSRDRVDHWACPKLLAQDMDILDDPECEDVDVFTLGDGDRLELNIAALYEHGTVEFRLHEGTLNYDEAEAWIKFGQTFMDNVAKRKRYAITTCANPEQLLKRIKVPKQAREKLLEKAVA